MTEQQEQAMQEIRYHQLAFLGRLLADFSHEMRNHLAVIQEANGLLEDLLAMEKGKENFLLTSLGESNAQIGKRVRAAGALCQHLSSMAHRSDTPRSFFQVNEVVIELAALLERSARSQQVCLQLELGQGIDPIYNEPALLHYVFYQLYVVVLDLMSRGQTMIIRTIQSEEGVKITFCFNPISLGESQEDVSGLTEIPESVLTALSALEARLEKLEKTGGGELDLYGFQLLVPSLPCTG
jgi:signal transduction histidine kinase